MSSSVVNTTNPYANVLKRHSSVPTPKSILTSTPDASVPIFAQVKLKPAMASPLASPPQVDTKPKLVLPKLLPVTPTTLPNPKPDVSFLSPLAHSKRAACEPKPNTMLVCPPSLFESPVAQQQPAKSFQLLSSLVQSPAPSPTAASPLSPVSPSTPSSTVSTLLRRRSSTTTVSTPPPPQENEEEEAPKRRLSISSLISPLFASNSKSNLDDEDSLDHNCALERPIIPLGRRRVPTMTKRFTSDVVEEDNIEVTDSSLLPVVVDTLVEDKKVDHHPLPAVEEKPRSQTLQEDVVSTVSTKAIHTNGVVESNSDSTNGVVASNSVNTDGVVAASSVEADGIVASNSVNTDGIVAAHSVNSVPSIVDIDEAIPVQPVDVDDAKVESLPVLAPIIAETNGDDVQISSKKVLRVAPESQEESPQSSPPQGPPPSKAKLRWLDVFRKYFSSNNSSDRKRRWSIRRKSTAQ